MELVVNENKTKFIAVGNNNDNISHILIDGYNIERVKAFVDLETYVDAESNCTEKFERRILAAKKSYYRLNKRFKSRLLRFIRHW